MKRFSPWSLFVLAFAAGCADDPSQPQLRRQLSEADGVTDTYLVRFLGNGVPADFNARVSALGGEVIFAHGGAGVAAVAGLIPSAAEQLGASAGVASMAADAYTTLEEPSGIEVEAVAVDVSVQSASNPAAAFFYPRQWHMQAIAAPAAWAAGKLGSSTIKVGILDTGIDYISPDLAGRVDLANSRSFLSATENARVQTAFPGAHEIADLHYHGTHVASTVVSNGLVNAGVTSGIQVVGLKVCAPGFPNSNPQLAWRGTCPTSGTLAAILYAADLGLPVINMSLGGRFNRRDGSAAGGDAPSFLAVVNQVFNYASNKGTLIVVSAGNENIDIDHDGNGYKTYCSAPLVVCVSATGPTAGALNGPWTDIDAKAGYSNYGRSAITVAAPGGNFRPVWATCSRFSLPIPVCQTGNFTVGISGTSMAAPHTSGVAALIASEGVTGPGQIRSRLQQSADDLGQPGVDPVYGKGRINAARAAGL